jgi:hypothetical protein
VVVVRKIPHSDGRFLGLRRLERIGVSNERRPGEGGAGKQKKDADEGGLMQREVHQGVREDSDYAERPRLCADA